MIVWHVVPALNHACGESEPVFDHSLFDHRDGEGSADGS
jgi:hypothetical protein